MSGIDLHLCVFAKYWDPGKVKTRLAATHGNETAARVYHAFVRTMLSRFGNTGRSRELVFAPDSREPEFRQLIASHQGTWDVQPQGVGDLGERMQRFFQRTLSSHRKVALMGSDSPTIPKDFIVQTDELLEENSVVLGPSQDGGYYLVAARDATPEIFSDIDWSTERVYRQTIAKLQSHGVRYATLPEWYDVDDESDLQRLCREAEHDVDDEYIGKLGEDLKQALILGQG